ncbi:putative NAD(P)H quinone oxidoreductase, PIG3 family [Arboricoccus pini]|uniref:Putative NAD(P)H quinone oxidoreductase, PIG3 family n=1 Tax=Arboricoccus pini TaxID=1963835 RepID=A0A212RTJ9_9PROT|nr:NAD(P)H-quinone oxidoreductase [Arboricoccus pini]SNB76063.1 putative NAD(P)H quinone oxidoreductase, PIG3 family [Arboricoccus pini]
MSSIPERMTYIELRGYGEPDVLQPAEGPVPRPGKGELLIKVMAAGVNRPDVLQRQGNYPPPPGATDVPGLEVAGIVVALGEDTHRFRLGDAVCALIVGGGYAEFAAVPEPQAMPVPESYSMIEAAALPETFLTVWTNVFERGRLEAGQTLLVHGGSSGIGTTAIQLAAARGATVFATAGNFAKVAACEKLGARRAINYREEDFVAVIKEMTDGKGVDVILDMVGGSYVPRNLKAAAVEGRIVQIAWLGGSTIEADMTLLMVKRLHWTGSTLRARPVAEKGAIARALEREVWPLLTERRVAPVIEAVLPLREAAQAHRLMEESQHVGKIVLSID